MVCYTNVCWNQDEDAEEQVEDTQQSSIDNYTGVSIKVRIIICFGNISHSSAVKVSFNSKVDEGLRIQQLSGGQKSLVALATGLFGNTLRVVCDD